MLCFLYAFGMLVICFCFPCLFVTMFSSSFLSDDDGTLSLQHGVFQVLGTRNPKSQDCLDSV